MAADQHLSALDTTFLELEDAEPSAHMHIGALLVFCGEAPALTALLERVGERLPGLPRYQQRLSGSRLGALHRPTWTDAPDFDLGTHVVLAAVPDSPGDAALLAWAGDYFSQRLDRERPLWELVLIPALSGGRWALASKTHHCLADGIGSLDALRLLIDGAEALPALTPSGTPEPSPLDVVRAALSLARHPLRALETSAAVAELAVRDELLPAVSNPLNVRIGTRRRLAVADSSLSDLKAIKTALGGTVNDVVLTAVTVGLRDLLLSRGEDCPAAGLRAMVPVNVRQDPDESAMGNRIVSLFVALPVFEADPLRRYELVCEQTAEAKAGRQGAGTAGLLGLAEWLPPVLHVPFSKSMFGKRLFNVTVTNVPGPSAVLSAFGSRLLQAIPIVPLAAEHAVGFAVLSQGGKVTFCVNADHDVVPDAAVAAQGVEAAIGDLRIVAAGRKRTGDPVVSRA
ncbi:MAG: diacylglycerol O-acyltransferase / wax synthase [Solirubrobacteraceae bacterium]|jgi:WS/DGAT/MGAT family acyltransferase|nr:diacylglycerol O-acyltransferase / wax synthase [Solirubrobacteraceae bacterium]